MNEPGTDLLNQLRRDGFIGDRPVRMSPLTGGVSSEIYRINDGKRTFVVKRALKKLKVEADWYADTSRNAYEQAYLSYVESLSPGAVPAIIGSNPETGYFCMEFLDGFKNWKSDLLGRVFETSLAVKAGSLLGRIHQTSWDDPVVPRTFDAMENFDQLRIDPYLRATAGKHGELSATILNEADRLRQSRQCLIHGDYSPKNMLHKDGRLVVLDCEVACHGDAAFDLAFLLNHLLLKALFHSPVSTTLPTLFEAVLSAYRAAIPERAVEIGTATARLLPMLLLARVDGKSPVEYLSPEKQSLARAFARTNILQPPSSLESFGQTWFAHL